jgi:hypothetical protein
MPRAAADGDERVLRPQGPVRGRLRAILATNMRPWQVGAHYTVATDSTTAVAAGGPFVTFDFWWKEYAGLVSAHCGDWSVHFGVCRTHWKWGHSVEPYDLCLSYWGVGPLVLLARCNI